MSDSGRTVRRLDSGVPDSLKSTRYSVSTEGIACCLYNLISYIYLLHKLVDTRVTITKVEYTMRGKIVTYGK